CIQANSEFRFMLNGNVFGLQFMTNYKMYTKEKDTKCSVYTKIYLNYGNKYLQKRSSYIIKEPRLNNDLYYVSLQMFSQKLADKKCTDYSSNSSEAICLTSCLTKHGQCTSNELQTLDPAADGTSSICRYRWN